MNLDISRRGFLTAVAAGVAAAIAPALPCLSAARLPGDLAYAAMTHDTTDFVARANGAMMMWEQTLRDYTKAEAICARVAAVIDTAVEKGQVPK